MGTLNYDFNELTPGGGAGANLPAYFTFQSPSSWGVETSLPGSVTGNAVVLETMPSTPNGTETWAWSTLRDDNGGNSYYDCEWYCQPGSPSAAQFLVFYFKQHKDTTSLSTFDFNNDGHFYGGFIKMQVQPGITTTTITGKSSFGPTISAVNVFNVSSGAWFKTRIWVWRNHVRVAIQRKSDGMWMDTSGNGHANPVWLVHMQNNYTNVNGGIGFGAYSENGAKVFFKNVGWSPSPQPFMFPVNTGPSPTPLAPVIETLALLDNSVTLQWQAAVGGTGAVTYQLQRVPTTGSAPALPNGTPVNVGSSTSALMGTDNNGGSGLASNTDFFYQVVATDSAGNTCTSGLYWIVTSNTARTTPQNWYFDSAAGSDGNGTIGSPFNHLDSGNCLTQCLNQLIADDTLILVSGSGHAAYNLTTSFKIQNQMGVKGHPIVITSSDTAHPAVLTNLGATAADGSAIQLIDTQYITVQYLSLVGPGLDSTNKTINTYGTGTISAGVGPNVGAFNGCGVLLTSRVRSLPQSTGSAYYGADWTAHRLNRNEVHFCTVNGYYCGLVAEGWGSHENFVNNDFYVINYAAGQDNAVFDNCTILNTCHLGWGFDAESYHTDPNNASLLVDPATDANAVHMYARRNPATGIPNVNISNMYVHHSMSVTHVCSSYALGDFRNASTYTGQPGLGAHCDGAYIYDCSFSWGGDWCQAGNGGPLGLFTMNCADVMVDACYAFKNTVFGGIDGGGFDCDRRSVCTWWRRCLSAFNRKGVGFEMAAYDGEAPAGTIFDHCASYKDPVTNPLILKGQRVVIENFSFYGTGSVGSIQFYNGIGMTVINSGFLFDGAGSPVVTVDASVTWENNAVYALNGATPSGPSATGFTNQNPVTGNPQLVGLSDPPTPTTPVIGTAATALAWAGLDVTLSTSAWSNSGVDPTTLGLSLTAPTLDLHGNNLVSTIHDVGAVQATPTAATGVSLSGPTSGTVGQASTNFTVALIPNGGTDSGVTVTPNDGGNGGTFAPTTVTLSTGTPSATFKYTPAVTGVIPINVTNNGGLTNPSGINYTSSPPAATGYSLLGPSAGQVGLPSLPYTVSLTPGGSTSGNVTITPSDGGAGGTFSPATVILSTANPSRTFTYQSPGLGTVTISTTNSGSLADPGSLTYTTIPIFRRRRAQEQKKMQPVPNGSPLAFMTSRGYASTTYSPDFDTSHLAGVALDGNATVVGGSGVVFVFQRQGADGLWYDVWTSASLSAPGSASATVGQGFEIPRGLAGRGRIGIRPTGGAATATLSAQACGSL